MPRAARATPPDSSRSDCGAGAVSMSWQLRQRVRVRREYLAHRRETLRMRRTIVVCISFGLLSTPSVSARDGQGGARAEDRHAELRRDVDAMNARLAGPRPTSQQV